MQWNESIFAIENNDSVMRMEKAVSNVREFLVWLYIMSVLGGLVYAVRMGQETKSPGEIIYEKAHMR